MPECDSLSVKCETIVKRKSLGQMAYWLGQCWVFFLAWWAL